MTSEGPCLWWEWRREPSSLWWGRPKASSDPQPTKSADLASGCKPPLALCNPRRFPHVSPGWGQRERWGDSPSAALWLGKDAQECHLARSQPGLGAGQSSRWPFTWLWDGGPVGHIADSGPLFALGRLVSLPEAGRLGSGTVAALRLLLVSSGAVRGAPEGSLRPLSPSTRTGSVMPSLAHGLVRG